jgi:HK97 family phage prohead protease
MKHKKANATFGFELDQKSFTKDDSNGVAIGRFSGYASTFNNVDETDDVCVKGCFKKSIAAKGAKRPLLWQHGMSELIGSVLVTEDEKGLLVQGSINLEVEKGEEAYALLKSGDLGSMSIGYSVKEWDMKDNIRQLKELDLFEVSLVTFPANVKAVVTDVKHMDAIVAAKSLSDIDDILVEAGFSKKEADTLISRVKKFGIKSQPDVDVNTDGGADEPAEDDKTIVHDEEKLKWFAVSMQLKNITNHIKG